MEETWGEETRVRREVWEVLHENPLGSDLLISMFSSAVHSYRYHSICRPFVPSSFFPNDDEGRKVERLCQILDEELPSVRNLHDECLSTKDGVSSDVLQFLHWLLVVHPAEISLLAVPMDRHLDILRLPSSEKIPRASSHHVCPSPNHIFTVRTKRNSLWKKRNETTPHNTIYGFHGSKFENIYSILCNGLQQHLNKRDLFGPGIYCSNELNITHLFSELGQTWRESVLGKQLSATVLCEILDTKDVKRHVKDTSQRGNNALPENYLVIRNNECIVNQYLLVYSKTPSHKLRNNWFVKNSMGLVIGAYVVLLLGIGLLQSTDFTRYLKNKNWLS